LPSTDRSTPIRSVYQDRDLLGYGFLGPGMEEYGQDRRPEGAESQRIEEQRGEVDLLGRRVRQVIPEGAPERIADQGSQAEDQEVEQALGAGPHVLREVLIDEDVHRCEEE